MPELVVVLLSYLVLVALYRLIGLALVKLFARLGAWIERVRTRWIDPPREAARAIRALLILSFVLQVTKWLAAPSSVAYFVFLILSLDLIGETRTYLACIARPASTLALHERGFFLLDNGPLKTRLATVAFVWGCHQFLPLIASGSEHLTGAILTGMRWLLL